MNHFVLFVNPVFFFCFRYRKAASASEEQDYSNA
jgi:hypothetical protein